MKHGKQPVFVRGAVVGRGPGSKDVGSPLDAEEISVTLSLGHTAFAGSCSCPQGLRSSRLPKAEAAGRGGPWGKSRDLGHTETVGAGGSCFEIKRKPRHKNKCLKKKKSLQRKQTLKAKPGEVCLRQALALPELTTGHRLCSFSPAQSVWEELAGCAAGAGAGGRGAGHPTRGRCSARARLSV